MPPCPVISVLRRSRRATVADAISGRKSPPGPLIMPQATPRSGRRCRPLFARSAKHVEMEVIDLLSTVLAGVDHRPEAVVAARLARKFRHLEHHSSKHLPITGSAIGQRVDVRLRNQQEVYRRLGADIV